MKSLTFVIPCYNAASNIKKLYNSLATQKDYDWKAIFIDDMSIDGTVAEIQTIDDSRVTVIINNNRKFALRNIIEVSKSLDSIIAIIDGDDQLCSDETVTLVKNAHVNEKTVAWTGHKWDINNINVSRDMPSDVNPYQYKWCSSHLKTFDASLLKDISDANFKNHNGEWFERGYDQALMLPLIFKSKYRKYISDICYLYNIKSCSMPVRDWSEQKQLKTVNFVRSRGFVK